MTRNGSLRRLNMTAATAYRRTALRTRGFGMTLTVKVESGPGL